jgi:tetratricopeptide (TPR) repeat protein
VYGILSILICFTMLVTLSHADMHAAVDSLLLKIEKNPNKFKLHYDLGLCYTALEEYEKALDAFARSLELNKDFNSAKYKMAVVYMEMDSLEIARSIFEELKGAYAGDKAINNWLRAVHHRCGIIDALNQEYESAIENYRAAIKFSDYPDDMENQLAVLYYKTDDTIQSAEYLKKSIDGIYDYYRTKKTAMWHSAIYHYHLQKYDDAIKIKNSIYSNDTTDAIVQYNLGVFNIASGEGKGLDIIRNAVDKDTTGFVSAVYSAILAVSTDSFSNAEALLTQDINALRMSGLAKGLLAWTLEQLGKNAEANRLWLKCYCQLPSGSDIESMRGFISEFIETVQTYRPQF